MAAKDLRDSLPGKGSERATGSGTFRKQRLFGQLQSGRRPAGLDFDSDGSHPHDTGRISA